MKNFDGNVFFIDRDNINTDEIIPAKYLTEIDKKNLKPYLLEDLTLNSFSTKILKNKHALITKSNFGCGSSREHAPWAFEQNGINIIIAESFARIFRQNMFNCGMLAISLDKNKIDKIFKEFSNLKNVKIKTNVEESSFKLISDGKTKKIVFPLSAFEKDLIKLDGWLNYADKKY
jgi:3-isopropylmalate/(R)-2-methylmalate dehydratase small subunit